ncbi:MAG: recombinase family protein [Acidobacteriota bacterium]|nr:recombinase family protein [Acidobacteriota bacterium]
MKQVIELIRVSTEEQAADDRASIPAQRAINRRTAQMFSLEIVRSIELTDVSGTAVLRTPEMQELLKLIESPSIHGVVAREFSRLMRPENYSDYALLQAFVDTNTLLYLPDGAIDFRSKMGRVVGTMQAVFAGVQRLEFLENIWNAKEEKRRKGGFAQSRVCLPYGVGFDERTGWHYTAKAERVREAFRRLLAGNSSYTELADFLGVSIPGFRVIMRNPIYAGWRVIDKRRDPLRRTYKPDGRQADRPKVARAPEDVISLKVIDEPLISESDFARAQRIMDSDRARNSRTRNFGEHRHAYNGFLRCASCGDLVYTHHRRVDYYVCKSRKLEKSCPTSYMRRDVVDPALDTLFARRLSDERFLRDIAGEFLSRGDKKPARSGFAGETQRLESRRSRVLEAFFDGAITPVERDARLAKIDEELTAVRGIPVREDDRPDLKSLSAVFRVFRRFDLLPRDKKRAILRAAVPEIRVANYKVEGVSLLLPRGGELTLTGTGSSPPRA